MLYIKDTPWVSMKLSMLSDDIIFLTSTVGSNLIPNVSKNLPALALSK